MATRILHYELPATVGTTAIEKMFAFRCSQCHEDFHIDQRPEVCPFCGCRFYQERGFGETREAAK